MGYDTYISGELLIEPPITRAALAELEHADDYTGGSTLDYMVQNVAYEPVHPDRSWPTRSVDISMLPVDRLHIEESMRWYDASSDIQNCIDALRRAGHTVEGTIDCDGEETDDVWRIIAKDGETLVEDQAHFWPSDLAPLIEAAEARIAGLGHLDEVQTLIDHLKSLV